MSKIAKVTEQIEKEITPIIEKVWRETSENNWTKITVDSRYDNDVIRIKVKESDGEL